jgi:hypothetical protein
MALVLLVLLLSSKVSDMGAATPTHVRGAQGQACNQRVCMEAQKHKRPCLPCCCCWMEGEGGSWCWYWC